MARSTTPGPFTARERVRLAGGKRDYGHRERNNWMVGDLPAPYALGDIVCLRDGVENERLYSNGRDGWFVVCAAYSIDEGDAWYFRVDDGVGDRRSDRLHVAFAARCTWLEDCDWMAGFDLIDTADPDGLALRQAMLRDGWTWNAPQRCPHCGREVADC